MESARAFKLAGVLFLGSLVGVWAEEKSALWSVKPVQGGKPPEAEDRNAIDVFLERGGSVDGAPTSAADRRSLIRRATYDLTGLPPTQSMVDAFLADSRETPVAFREIVDQLLASPHYGEHWGRHWLDVVRYADTAGENSDHPLPHAWRYRNWVIDAFNADLPYDQFVKDQIAGDLFHQEASDDVRNAGIIATGYLAISRRFGHDIDKRMHLMFEDTIDNLGKAFLGLSIACARCHDHKHDSIPARDYYALYSVFDSTRFSFPGCEPKQQPRDLISLTGGDVEEERRRWEERGKELKTLSRADEIPAKSKELQELASSAFRVLTTGAVPDGGEVKVAKDPLVVSVRKGTALQLAILPGGNHGADTTIVDFSISHGSGEESLQWTLSDHLDDLLTGNPLPSKHGAAWCFLDIASDPKILPVRNKAVQESADLQSWSTGGLPSVMVNRANQSIKKWTSLPGRTFYCHPSEAGGVAIAWLSPVDGEIRIDLTIKDGHPAGDGVEWRLEYFSDPGMAQAYQELGKVSVRPEGLDEALAKHAAAEPKIAVAYAVAEGEHRPGRIHERGDPELLGATVDRTFLELLGGKSLGDGSESGRRELAELIVSPDNPLTARVMANRIWAGHFGRGLVTTPNDFGNHGARPTHPELLDYLAQTFVESGWRVKSLHRLIMNSAAYQRAAAEGSEPSDYRTFQRRRLTAEELRDTLLVASGALDRTPGEAHPFPPEAKWSFTQHSPFAAEYETNKRSVYVMRKRNREHRFFALFDGADPNASTAKREITTAPTQALYFLNDPFFHRCAATFATRMMESGKSTPERLDFACRELFARSVREDEVDSFEQFRKDMFEVLPGPEGEREAAVWKAWARVLLGSNELLYLD